MKLRYIKASGPSDDESDFLQNLAEEVMRLYSHCMQRESEREAFLAAKGLGVKGFIICGGTNQPQANYLPLLCPNLEVPHFGFN